MQPYRNIHSLKMSVNSHHAQEAAINENGITFFDENKSLFSYILVTTFDTCIWGQSSAYGFDPMHVPVINK